MRSTAGLLVLHTPWILQHQTNPSGDATAASSFFGVSQVELILSISTWNKHIKSHSPYVWTKVLWDQKHRGYECSSHQVDLFKLPTENTPVWREDKLHTSQNSGGRKLGRGRLDNLMSCVSFQHQKKRVCPNLLLKNQIDSRKWHIYIYIHGTYNIWTLWGCKML